MQHTQGVPARGYAHTHTPQSCHHLGLRDPCFTWPPPSFPLATRRWLGDLWICRVKDVVGPPYSIHDIEPKIGAVTGNSLCTIRGMGFENVKGDAGVAVCCPKGQIEVPATVKSDTEMEFTTPDYTSFGEAQEVQCRTKISSAGLTNTAVQLKMFEVTSCEESIVFGPGILDGCAAGVPVSVIIQAKDTNGADRW